MLPPSGQVKNRRRIATRLLVLGFGFGYLAYRLFASKKKPTAAARLVGFLCLLAGSLLLFWFAFLLLFVIS